MSQILWAGRYTGEEDTLWREIPLGTIYSEEGDVLGNEIYLTHEYYDGIIYDGKIWQGFRKTATLYLRPTTLYLRPTTQNFLDD